MPRLICIFGKLIIYTNFTNCDTKMIIKTFLSRYIGTFKDGSVNFKVLKEA